MNEQQEQQAAYKTGVVSAIDPKSVKARVRFDDLDGLETAMIPVGQRKTLHDKDYWMPDVGEHVACLMDANFEDGVILCAVYSDADAAPTDDPNVRMVRFRDGAEIAYDRVAHTLTIKGGVEKVVIEAASEIVLQAPRVTVNSPAVAFTGDVQVAGTLMDAGGNSNRHTH